MTDPSDKKSKEKLDNLDGELDAMQDESEWPAFSIDELQDDDEALDRLLMNTDFDDAPEQLNTETVSALDPLDDFSGFSYFDEPEVIPPAAVDDSDQVMESSSAVVDDEVDDFDELDLIQDDEASAPAVADLASVNEQPQADIEEPGGDDDAFEALDGFSDFSDFDEPEIIPAAAVDDFGQVMESSSAVVEDEVDDFDELDLIQDDEASVPAVADLASVNEQPQAVIEEPGEDDDAFEALDGFSDFSDFDEPEIIPATAVDDSGQVMESSSAVVADEADDFFSLSDDFDELDLIQDDEASAPAVADLASVNEQPQADIEEPGGDDDAFEALDGLSDFSDFDEPEVIPPAAVDDSDQVMESSSAVVDDEADDFFSLSDDFDELDLIQDDEIGALADLAEQSADDEAASESLLLDVGDALEKADGEAGELVEDADLSDDDFDDSDMIHVDEIDDWADLVTSIEEPQPVGKEPSDDLSDDEYNIDSLLLDSGFDEENTDEEAIGDKDEFGGDADSIETNDFFQLDEVSDDFSGQISTDLLTETEALSKQDNQEDDFLLPDFDITADTEISDLVSDAGTTEVEMDEDFGSIDFLNEEEALKVFGQEELEQKPGNNETIVDPEPKQPAAVDTGMAAIEDVEDLKLSPFGFEQEDIKKQLEEAENRVKKAKLFSYVAIGFGAVALSVAVGLGIVTYGAKSEFSKLTEVVSTLEANLAKNAESSSNIVVKQDMVSKELDMLQAKMGGLEGKTPLAPSVAESGKAEAAHAPVPVRATSASEPAKAKTEAEQEPAPSKDEAGHKTTPVPTKVEAVPAKIKSQPEAVPVKEKAQPEVAPVKAKVQPEEAVPAKPKTVEKAVVKPEPVKEKKPAAPGKWGVNLGAFKQEWFAKSKAAEYGQQGIFAEVIPVHEKNTTMYRLRVEGFKTKAEADSNTARIKRALNLDSVWVSDN